MRPVSRKLIVNVHLLLALIAGPFLIILGVTGALLVFAAPLDLALNRDLLVVAPSGARASLEAIVSPARRTRSGAGIARVVLPQQPDQSLEVRFDDGLSVFVDPLSSRVLGSRRTAGHAVDALLALHIGLLSGAVGSFIVGAASVAALFSAATGLFLWWPRRVLKLRGRGSWKGTNFDLHQVIGFYASAFLMLVVLAGVSIHYNDASGRIVRGTLASPAPPPLARVKVPSADPEAGRISLDNAVGAARQALPGAMPTFVVPGRGGQPVWVQMRFPEDPNEAGRSSIYLHPYDGSVLRTLSTRERDRQGRLILRSAASPRGMQAFAVGR